MRTEISAIVKQDGAESLADFVGLFTDRDYEEGLKDFTERSANHKGSKIQLSRLRIAWMVAKRDSHAAKAPDDGDLEARWGRRSPRGKRQSFGLNTVACSCLQRFPQPQHSSTVCAASFESSRRALKSWAEFAALPTL